MSENVPFDPESYDLCIIGAGISGLSLARMAASWLGQRVLVLEKHPEAGGCLASVPVAGGGWLELGAHTCYNSYARFLGLVGETDFLSRVVPRKNMGFRMVEGGVLRSIPSCLDFFDLACSVPRMFGASKEGRTAEAYYSRILGRKNWARVLHPSLNAVASQETSGFPADALFKARGARRKDVARSFAVRGGLGPAVQALADHPRITCFKGDEATGVSAGAPGYRIRTASGAGFTARRLAVAVPPQAAAGLLVETFPAVAEQLGRIGTREVKSLGLVFKDPLAQVPRLAGLILPGGPCFSAVSGDAFPVPGRRAWTFHFDGTKAGAPEDMVAYACQVLGTTPATVEATFRKDHTMPAIAMGHDAWLKGLDASLEGTELMVVGNYLTGLSIEDCAGRALGEFQRVNKS
jgi:protoporphyrinogen oxidase